MALTLPIERIEERARAADPRRVLLTVLLAVPFVLGWLAGRAWLALAYVWSAVIAGWQAATARREGEDRAEG